MSSETWIVLIDDDADDHEIFSMLISQVCSDGRCIFFQGGIEALQYFDSEMNFLPDIIFLDMNMPKMDGMKCLEELRKLPRLRSASIYMYSTSAEPSIVEKCQQLGATGFIRKEPDIDRLQEVISNTISQHKNSAA